MFGAAIRQIRQEKGLTLIDLSDGILAKSQLSRFERGESQVAVTSFFQLLNRLNITFDEMLVYTQQKDDFRELINQVAPRYAKGDKDWLQAIIAQLEAKPLKTPYTVTMLKALLESLGGDQGPSEEELAQLTDYLFTVEFWGQYEITLLGNCAKVISFETLYLLTVELIKKRQATLSQDPGNRKLVVQLAINCLEECVDHFAFQRAAWLIKKIPEILIIESEFFEQTIYTYMKGYYQWQKGVVDGDSAMKDALTVLKLMAPEEFFQTYKTHYEQVMNTDS
ncbi:helix-turn-helix domain-containing protein [Streptococcus merionis]|uniref:Regulatory protein n=1 Tax=Streptococcus merionis TaxID=400065 RepID=A0A239SMM6_9STRE|nr:Rgg/GadR/MutR family transcriptional regulator [Streptococcus merionis]SNU86014.1 regulatory protein [Streptococcus merionis]